MKKIAMITFAAAMVLIAPVAFAQGGGGAEGGSDPSHTGDGGTIKARGNSSNTDTMRRSHHRSRHHHHRRMHRHHR